MPLFAGGGWGRGGVEVDETKPAKNALPLENAPVQTGVKRVIVNLSGSRGDKQTCPAHGGHRHVQHMEDTDRSST